MNIYVGNLAWGINEETLKNLFGEYGTVDTARVITDRNSGRSKGFGFVEMSNESKAQEAIEALNGKELEGRALRVNEARPASDNDSRRRRY
ncbi:MAG: RNA-binding protein [Candidatus Marinimicrobia bacterium]|nr:RNA-binding protein [Candidatus Neomarinimicrobiota bacterium]